jgi:hypothetical protein
MGFRRPVLRTELPAGPPFGTPSKYRADRVCGVSIRFLDEVRVDTKSRRRIRVTQTAAHRTGTPSDSRQVAVKCRRS